MLEFLKKRMKTSASQATRAANVTNIRAAPREACAERNSRTAEAAYLSTVERSRSMGPSNLPSSWRNTSSKQREPAPWPSDLKPEHLPGGSHERDARRPLDGAGPKDTSE